jgi:hypothetical protein
VLVEERRAAAEFLRWIIFQDRPDDSAFREGRSGRNSTGQRRGDKPRTQHTKRLTARPFSRTLISTHGPWLHFDPMSIFGLKSCLLTASGCQSPVSGEFGTSPFLGSSSVKAISLTTSQRTHS